MSLLRSIGLLLAWVLLMPPPPAEAQSSDDYDASWYDPDAPHVQIDVTADGVYRVTGDALEEALPSEIGRAHV